MGNVHDIYTVFLGDQVVVDKSAGHASLNVQLIRIMVRAFLWSGTEIAVQDVVEIPVPHKQRYRAVVLILDFRWLVALPEHNSVCRHYDRLGAFTQANPQAHWNSFERASLS